MSLFLATDRGRTCGHHFPPGQQFRQIIIDAGHAKIRFTLERLAEIMHPMSIACQELDNGENKAVR